MIAPIVLWGTITWYSCSEYAGDLRCGGVCDASHVWAAADIDALGWQCGDALVIWSGGVRYDLPVRDSGPLSRYAVDWPGVGLLPIVADIPEHAAWWDGLSTRGIVANASEARRQLERER